MKTSVYPATVVIPVRLYKQLVDLIPPKQEIFDNVSDEFILPDAICDRCGTISDKMLDGDACPTCQYCQPLK